MGGSELHKIFPSESSASVVGNHTPLHQFLFVNGFQERWHCSSCSSQDFPEVSWDDARLKGRDNTALKPRVLLSSKNFSHFKFSDIFLESSAHEFVYNRKWQCLFGGKLICLDTGKALWVLCIKNAFRVLYSLLSCFHWFHVNVAAELLCFCQCKISNLPVRWYEQFIAVSFHKTVSFLWLFFFLKKVKNPTLSASFA